MARKRRLTDLYKIGKEVVINDDSGGEPVKVYVRKLNPVDHETALRRANAVRAKILASLKDIHSDIYNDVYSEVLEMGRDSLVAFAIAEEVGKITSSAEAELAAADEWSKNDYLQGLYDSWAEEMRERNANDPEDEEALRVRLELERFETSVKELVDGETQRLKDDLDDTPLDDLREIALEKLLDIRADTEWIKEFRRCEIWLAVREDDKKTRYFESRAEVDDLEAEVLRRLIDEYQSLAVEPSEGKSLPRTDTSSNSSDPREEPGQEQPSSPKE